MTQSREKSLKKLRRDLIAVEAAYDKVLTENAAMEQELAMLRDENAQLHAENVMWLENPGQPAVPRESYDAVLQSYKYYEAAFREQRDRANKLYIENEELKKTLAATPTWYVQPGTISSTTSWGATSWTYGAFDWTTGR